MLPLEHSDRIRIAFDDHRLVANAGLLLPARLALAWVWVNWQTATPDQLDVAGPGPVHGHHEYPDAMLATVLVQVG